MGRPSGPRFQFTAPLVKLDRGKTAVWILEVPERITKAVGRRGPIPMEALLNRSADLQASLVPMGGGRHWIQLNARIRAELDIKAGDRVRVELTVPERPTALPLPDDLRDALREADLQETFAKFPVGKQNHIILWIEESKRPETREKRVGITIQVAFRARERAAELLKPRNSGSKPH